MSRVKICPKCGAIAEWDSYFGGTRCTRCDFVEKPKPTHGGQIRAKTDEQLAAMFSRLVGCPLTVMEDCPKGHSPDEKCKAYKCWLDWLKEVAE